MMFRKFSAVAIATAIYWPVIASAQMSERSGEYWHSDWGWDHMVFGSFMMVVFWALVIAAVVLVVRLFIGRAHSGRDQTPRNSALEILRESYARGELDREEFEERKRLLEG